MIGTTRVVHLPNGLEIAVEERGDGLALRSFRLRSSRAGIVTSLSGAKTTAGNLAAKRFQTIEEMVRAIEREIGDS